MAVALNDGPEFLKTVFDADPLAPEPTVQPVTFATAADIRKIMSSIRWLCEGWIPASSVVGLASLEGVGKSRLAMDLYLGLPWPDGQAMTLPAKTPSLWLPADGQHDEIVDMLSAFGLPDEAVIFPAPSDDPYANTSLDDPETLVKIDAAIVARKPWALFVDSLTYATTRDLCEQKSIAILKRPLVDLVQRHQINIMLLLHLSASGQALGKRVKGITRTLLHLECPDREKSERLRFWVEKSYGKKPAALGVVMGDGGNTYDFTPPARLGPDKGGRPAVKRDNAKQFIRDALTWQNEQIGNDLCTKWEAGGGSSKTFWRAVDDLESAADIATDGGTGTGKQTILHLIDLEGSDIRPRQAPCQAARGTVRLALGHEALTLVNEAAACLWGPRGGTALAYLHGRGLTDETIKDRGLGYVVNAMVPTKDDDRRFLFSGIVIPWRDGDRLTRIKIRRLDDGKPKYVQAYSDRPLIFPDPAVIRSGWPLIVGEGEFDAMLLGQQLPEASVITLGSASARTDPAVLSRMLSAPRWFIALDADQAGDTAASKFPARAIRVCPPVDPPLKDWGDVHREGANRIRYHWGRYLPMSKKWEEMEPKGDLA